MIVRSLACRKAGIATKGSIVRSTAGNKGLATLPPSKNASTREIEKAVRQSVDRSPGSRLCPYTSLTEAKKQKRAQDREFLLTVLESSATKRDAKTYLQTFGPAVTQEKAKTPESSHDDTGLSSDRPNTAKRADGGLEETPHIAVVKLRRPQDWEDAVLKGVAETLAQLNYLGMASLIVLDCERHGGLGYRELRQAIQLQMERLSSEIGRYSGTAPKIMRSEINRTSESASVSPYLSSSLMVDVDEEMLSELRAGQLVITPALVINKELTEEAADANEVVYTLVKYLSGLQPRAPSLDGAPELPPRKAWVDRVIIIDPVGGIPSRRKGHGVNVFINMEDEFEVIEQNLAQQLHTSNKARPEPATGTSVSDTDARKHWENLNLAKRTLSNLPPTSSVVITTPIEAANLDARPRKAELTGEVRTRRKRNTLIHNLLTDRPVHSSSLPIERIKPAQEEAIPETKMSATTLAKRGLPVTVFPDPRASPWMPPKPGAPRLRLTDTCIDLPRLIHLVDDSFNRKLDIEHYLQRVNDSLAGIVIAGEYEGGAILTWEKPHDMDDETAYKTGRFVPYLDKFAVLKKSQGAGGVADIVFNAMVHDCFPDGVCWRSRKDNPVNKWYFERSQGTVKLPDSNWAMFWTTPEDLMGTHTLKDYEDVCQNVVPSWKDGKSVVD